ncbi:MAG: orotidine-5'-phosphate decarboxylase [Cyanobacteriota bacterium]
MNKKNKPAKDRIILSLDVDDIQSAEKLVKKLKNYVSTFKVGINLFTAEGPKIFDIIHNEGAKVYYDSKYHDLPHTIAKAAEVLVKQKVDFFSLHIIGGSTMIEACVEATNNIVKDTEQNKPIIFGITILTSIGQKTLKKELGVPGTTQDHCLRLAKIAKKSGLDGIVVGGCDLKFISNEVDKNLIILTTAIRPAWATLNDQKRVLTPKEAIEAGSDYLLIGRPVTQAEDPVSAIMLIIDEVEEAIEGNI